MAASDARPVPRKNAAWRVYFAIRKSDGTLITSWTGADSEVSKDGGSFADCTDEATEVGTSGCGYLDLSASEMNADAVTIKITVTNSGALPLVLTVFPEEAGDYRADVVQISGDATAADNLEAALDGTGGVTLSVVLGTDAITAASLAASAGAELAALVETYIVNEGDATAVMQAIADKIAADWVAGDASPLAIVAAIKADATIATMISRVDATVSSRSSHSAADVLTALGTGTWATAIPWNAAWDAEVQSEVQDAIEVNNLDHLVKIAVDTDFGTTVHLNSVIGHLADNGTSATFSRTTDSLEAIRDRGDAAWVTGSGGGGGSGTGARTVTITVNDGTTVLQNATVRLTEGANTFTASTNASGVATFNVDDATYTVAITKAGYSYSGTTLVVNGTEAETYSMTAITITPSTGDQTTGYLTTLDETGQAEAGVSIYVSVADVPNDYGLALDEATRTVVSDEDGLVEITGMVKGATYNLRRGLKGRLYAVTIPTSAGSTYELPNMAGV